MTRDEAVTFYTSRYAFIDPLFIRPGQKRVVLGDRLNRQCRFCGGAPPQASFKMDAHAIPEALGNKVLFSAYECDACNQLFGRGIENDFGNWSKPLRSLARIRGKNGVPTLKKGGDEPGWRIEYGASGFEIKHYEADPILTVDEAAKKVVFTLKRDTYTPVAVLKAFVKIGLTVLPPEELANFEDALAWVRETDHSKTFVSELPIFYTFVSGPMPNDMIALWMLRRKAGIEDAPYAFLILAYGNEIFQVCLPSPLRDQCIVGKPLDLPHFPTPDGPDPAVYGAPRRKLIDLTGCEPVKGEVMQLAMGFERAVKVTPGAEGA